MTLLDYTATITFMHIYLGQLEKSFFFTKSYLLVSLVLANKIGELVNNMFTYRTL